MQQHILNKLALKGNYYSDLKALKILCKTSYFTDPYLAVIVVHRRYIIIFTHKSFFWPTLRETTVINVINHNQKI